MMNEIIVIPSTEPKETSLQISKSIVSKEAIVIPLAVEKRFPVPPLEFPVTQWIMPPEQHGYIQPNDNDCL